MTKEHQKLVIQALEGQILAASVILACRSGESCEDVAAPFIAQHEEAIKAFKAEQESLTNG